MPKTRRRRKRRKTRFKRRKKSKIRRRRRRSRRRRRGGRPVLDAGNNSGDDSVSSQPSANFTPVQHSAIRDQVMQCEAWENTLRNFLINHRPRARRRGSRPAQHAAVLQDRVNLEQEILNTMRQGGGDGGIGYHLLRGEPDVAETMRTAVIEEMALERARLSRHRRRARAARLP